jgi:hypothetical protein
MMNPRQLTLARAAEAKLQEALAACEALTEFERTNAVATRVAFTQLPRQNVEQWQARLNAVDGGTLTA